MGTYVVTGVASGMGRAAATQLREAGHTVIGVDIREAEVVVDLSTAAGRRNAAAAVLEISGGTLDGAILAAGLGPHPGNDRVIVEVNYFGVVDLLAALRPAFARSKRAKVVVIASNSTTTTPMVPGRAIRALLSGDADKAVRAVRFARKKSSALVYAATKVAVSRWVRRHAVTAEWAGEGIRLNALAPGAIMTPLLEEQLRDLQGAKAVRSFPLPIGYFGDAAQLAEWMVFMLSDAADFLCGSVIFVDGGSDAYFRAESWPTPVPVVGLPRYISRFVRNSRVG